MTNCDKCGEYNTADNRCDKFCKVIRETVDELRSQYDSQRYGWINIEDGLPESSMIQVVVARVCENYDDDSSYPQTIYDFAYCHIDRNGVVYWDFFSEDSFGLYNYEVAAWKYIEPYCA